MIYHFQNSCFIYFHDFCDYLFSSKIIYPDDLQIVTCSNDESKSILIKQLKLNGIKYINKVPQGCQWDNRDKIKYILSALDDVTSKYVLILDANDVLLEGDLSHCVNTFNETNKKIIYNATKYNYPKVKVGVVKNKNKLGKFRYLNAGCCIGCTDYAKKFYKHALKYINIENPLKSEQLIIRHAFRDRRKYVDFDWKTTIFQTVGGCSIIKYGKTWVIV